MKQNKNLTVRIVIGLIVLIILISGCTLKQTSQKIDCTAFKQSFDDYTEKSFLPIIENKESLCYGLNTESDFSKLSPKWAVGKLLNIKKESDYWLTFEGATKEGTIQIPLTEEEASKYKVGKYYKIDMNNMCRYFFMMADSQYPSLISSTFVKPEEIDCK